MRARNLNGEIIKVNDLRGNPIEIGASDYYYVVIEFSSSWAPFWTRRPDNRA